MATFDLSKIPVLEMPKKTVTINKVEVKIHPVNGEARLRIVGTGFANEEDAAIRRLRLALVGGADMTEAEIDRLFAMPGGWHFADELAKEITALTIEWEKTLLSEAEQAEKN